MPSTLTLTRCNGLIAVNRNSHGVVMPSQPIQYGARRRFDHDAMIALYATGKHSQLALAKKYGVTSGAICRVLQEKAPHLRCLPSGRPRTFDYEAAGAMFRNGHSVESLAAIFGASLPVMRYCLRKQKLLAVPTRKPRTTFRPAVNPPLGGTACVVDVPRKATRPKTKGRRKPVIPKAKKAA
jgi:hypothetical protein